jgi:hypothetical protein
MKDEGGVKTLQVIWKTLLGSELTQILLAKSQYFNQMQRMLSQHLPVNKVANPTSTTSRGSAKATMAATILDMVISMAPRVG